MTLNYHALKFFLPFPSFHQNFYQKFHLKALSWLVRKLVFWVFYENIKFKLLKLELMFEPLSNILKRLIKMTSHCSKSSFTLLCDEEKLGCYSFIFFFSSIPLRNLILSELLVIWLYSMMMREEKEDEKVSFLNFSKRIRIKSSSFLSLQLIINEAEIDIILKRGKSELWKLLTLILLSGSVLFFVALKGWKFKF